MSTIRWLHLSDLHAGAAGKPLLHHLFSKLEADIREHARAGWTAPDLILFTGDLAFSGQRAQYEEVNRYIDRIRGWLRDAWEGCDPLLFAVPGNHDLIRPEYDRDEDEDVEAHEDRLDWYDECLMRYEEGASRRQKRLRRMWSDGKDGKLEPNLAGPFRHYSEWARSHVYERLEKDRRCKHLHASFFPGDLSAVIEKDGFRLGLVGLNSSWVQYSGDEFEGKLQLPVEQFHAALPACGGSPLDFFKECHRALLLMHHPPRWLTARAQEDFRQLIYDPTHFVACLYGHMHASRSEARSESGGPTRVYMQAPSLFGLEHYGSTEKEQDRAFGYAWGEICRDGSLRIWPRQLSDENDADVWRFERDRRASYQGSNDWYWLREPQRRDMTTDAAPGPVSKESRTGEDYARHLPAYATWARRHFEYLPMVGLGDGDLELTLDEVYVPLSFAPSERGWAPRTDKEQMRRDGPESVELREAFKQAGNRHLFVRGEPGSGKTTALKKLLWWLLSADSAFGFDGRALGLPADTVPVFLRMRELAGPALDRDFGEVLDDALVAATRPGAHVDGVSALSIVPPGVGRWLWERGRVLLLLDGLDEIATRDVRREVCRHVEKLAEEGMSRGIRVVASSRFAGIEKEGAINLDTHRFLHLDVRPLDDSKIAQLVEKWYVAAGRARSRMRREHEGLGAARGSVDAQRLLDALQRNASIKLIELASTPLFLTLLCMVTERGGQMPERRVDFFRACLDTLLGIRASERAGERLLNLDESLDLLGAVAWGMHKEERQYDLDEEKLRALLVEPLRGFRNQRTRRPVVTFNAVLRWFRDVGGVLVDYAEGEHGFLHLGLQEYLAARYAAAYPTEGIEMLATHFGTSWWREVALLFVALSGYRHFGPLMKEVMARGKLVAEREQVYQCLIEAHARDLTPFLELIANRGAPVEQRGEALRLVRDQDDDELIKLVSAVVLEPPPAEADEGTIHAWTELRLLAEQVEAQAPPMEPAPVDASAVDVLLICDTAVDPFAHEVASIINAWEWTTAVELAQHAQDVWLNARSVVVLVDPSSHGPWHSLTSRQYLLQVARRNVPILLVLGRGTDLRELPMFLSNSRSIDLTEGLLQSSLRTALAEMLGRDAPLVARAVPVRMNGSVAMTTPVAEDRGSGRGLLYRDLQGITEASTGIRLLHVPGGTFWMGADDLSDYERPSHCVQVSPYWLAETLVTNRQYEMFLRTQRGAPEPHFWRDRRFNQPEQPVVGVSWMAAKAFCRWLTEKVSKWKFDLPTEAEWEFAARGENGWKYPWGDEEPDERRAHFGKDLERDAPLPVGSLPAGRGAYGHLDLAGNVWEWCRDAWDDKAYQKRGDITIDPVGPGAADDDPAVDRACRGGAFNYEPRFLRAAFRESLQAGIVSGVHGFRVAGLFPSR